MTSLWAPLDPANINDPYPMYKEIRERGTAYKAPTTEWIITGYADVEAILKDKTFSAGYRQEWLRKGVDYFRNKEKDFSIVAKALDQFILFINPPRHTILRRWLYEKWDNREVDNIIRENVTTLLDAVEDSDQIDLIQDFAKPLPSMTIARILGVPLDDFRDLLMAGHQMAKVLDLYNTMEDLVTMEKGASFLVDYFLEHVRSVKSNPDGGLISKLVNENDPNLSDEELASICILLLTAGQETSVGLIGTGLLNLWKQEQVKDAYLDGGLDISKLVDELLRYDCPAQFLGRRASQDVDYKEISFRKGDLLTLSLGGANRDPAMFDNPDELQPERSPNRHLAFGSGIHYCMGDWLGKRQGELAIGAFMAQFPGYKVEESELKWDRHLAVRKLENLPVKV